MGFKTRSLRSDVRGQNFELEIGDFGSASLAFGVIGSLRYAVIGCKRQSAEERFRISDWGF